MSVLRSVPRVKRSLFAVENVICRQASVRKPHVVVFTDGSCLRNGSDEAEAGVGVYWGLDHPWNLSRRISVQPTTNMRAELWAAILALQQACSKGSTLSRLLVCTDSSVLVKSMQDWLPDWQRRGWKRSSGKAVELRAELEEILALESHLKSVTWRFVTRDENLEAHRLAHLAFKAASDPLQVGKSAPIT